MAPSYLKELTRQFEQLLPFPRDKGIVELIVCRPAVGKRKILEKGRISKDEGLQGDNWKERGSHHTSDGSAHSDQQVTLINSKVIALITEGIDQWKMAGDQFYVDFDLSRDNLPIGTLLKLGNAEIMISDMRHSAQRKFVKYFGKDAARFFNSKLGQKHRLRGVKAKVVKEGMVAVGEFVQKVSV